MNNELHGISGTSTWAIDQDGTLTIGGGALSETPFSELLAEHSDAVVAISISLDHIVILPPNCDSLFAKLSNLKHFYGAERLNTSGVTNMSALFTQDEKLTSLDVSRWDTSNVVDMSFVFYDAAHLCSLDVSRWDTSNVQNMSFMFENARSLTNLDVSHWDTSNVESMNSMFSNARNLASIDVSHWDTSNVVDMSHMFENARSLTNLDVTHWDTSNVESMESMFLGTTHPAPMAPPVAPRPIEPLPVVDADSDLSEAYTALLARAREAFHVPALSSVDEVCDYVLSLGSVPLDFEKYRESIADEFVDERYVAGAFTLYDPQLLDSRAKTIEKEMFVNPVDESFDPLEFGAENQEWTTFAYEVEGLKRLHIIIEHSPDNRDAPGNFRVHGGGQWLRESLWAATGIVPRDVGAADDESELFGQAFTFVGREQFTSQEI